MIEFMSGSLIVLGWWATWTAYIKYLRRTSQLHRFHSGIYDLCTLAYALLALILSAAHITPFTLPQLRSGPIDYLIAAASGIALWSLQLIYLWHARHRTNSDCALGHYPVRRPYLLPLTAATEEILFRGCLLYGLIFLGVPPAGAILATGMLFGSLHAFQYGLYGVVLHTVTGIAFGILAVRFGLGAAVVAHVIFNAMALLTARGPARSPTTERAGHGRPAGE